MQARTRLGMSLGQLLSSTFDQSAAHRGMQEGMRDNELYSQKMLNDAKRQETLADAELKRRQLSLDPHEIAAGQLGIDGSLGQQLKKHMLTGDYGNGSINVQNNLPTGERNLSHSWKTEFIKPEGWDDDKARRYGQAYSAIKYAMTQGEKNPENYVKAINATNQGDFLRGDTRQDIVDRGYREAVINGNVGDIFKTRMLDRVATGGLDPQRFNSLVQALTLGNGDQLYHFGDWGVGDNVTGQQTLNGIGQSEIDLKKSQASNQRSNMAVDQARIRNLDAKTRAGFDEDGNPVINVTPTQKANNQEILLARKRMAGMTMDDVKAKTQQFLPNGRENPEFNPIIAQAYRTANQRMVGDDPTFDRFVQTTQPIKKQASNASPVDRFRADPAMRGFTMGTRTAKGWEVRDAQGKLVGHWQ